jgi:division protein CdvB (Snf7/Vps24/ESCRT-III family)
VEAAKALVELNKLANRLDKLASRLAALVPTAAEPARRKGKG